MSKFRTILACCAVGALFSLAGCGGNKEDPADSKPPPGAATMSIGGSAPTGGAASAPATAKPKAE